MVCIGVPVGGGTHAMVCVCVWRADTKLRELVLSSCHVDPQDGAPGFAAGAFTLVSQLTRLQYKYLVENV